jgi:molybdopterin-containing oxidoreductase family iron-sulfur binding subunit
MSIATAKELGAKEGSMMNLKVNGKTFELPAHIQPGLHDQVLAVAVGYGRTAAGKVGNNIGMNAFEMVAFQPNGMPIFSGAKTEISNTGVKYDLANPQGHHSMEGRQIVAEATLAQWLKDPGAGKHNHHVFSIWSGHAYNGHKWGMAVDLNTCTGCNACVVACQSENNIPVVGKKYVIQGREMHWIRVDRYYVGDPANAETVFQPLMCQHCDNAPCETVCPVAATVHNSEGLNDMVYNRCVGTRYCSNNCPYKVRRFNWFNYAKLIEKPMHLALNPDVGVRTRGVMEKCSFCVHRIKEGKNVAKLEKRDLKDGEIKTACQQVCPADAIVFGDMNDPNSRVSQMFKDARSYSLLEEFHAAPNVRYQTKIRNNGQETRGTDAGKGGHS